MNITLEKILEFQDLFPSEKEFDAKKVLCKYNRNKIVRIINCLGMNYGNAHIPDNDNLFFSDISRKRIEELNPLLEKHLKTHNTHQVIFCTQRTILELMRIAFSIPISDFQDNGLDEDGEYDLFRILLYINQQLMSYKTSDDIDISILTFFINYVHNDVTNADWKQILQTQIYYVDCLSGFLKSNSKGKELKDRFLATIGISSLKEYVQTVFALIFLYIDEKNKNRRGCPILDLNTIQDEVGFIHKEVCDFLSLGINEVIQYNIKDKKNDRENNVDYRYFRARPLVKIADSQYIIYNLPLICERLYNSLFFDLKNTWEEGDYFQFYTTEFVEKHLFHRTMLKCLGRKSTHNYPSNEEILSENHIPESPDQPDFYIREKDALILFECKGIKINGTLKDRADIDKIMAELKNKLYFNKEKKKDLGIKQLVKHLNLIEDDEFRFDSKIPDDVSYYPVIVLEDPKLCQMGIAGIINSWYQPLIKEQLNGTMCHPVIVISIDTLFLYSETFKRLGFHTVFDQFYKSNTIRDTKGVDWQLNPLADFNDFTQNTYKVHPSKQEFSLQLINKLQS